MTQPGPVDWRSIDESARPGAESQHRGVDGRLLLVGAAGLLALAVLAGAFLVLAAPQPALLVEGAEASDPRTSSATAATDVWVDVSGAVRRPGLYRLAAGSRLGDAVRTAGGFGPTVDAAAAERQLNLASVLEDGAKVHVPARGEATPLPLASSGGAAAGLVDLNVATTSELEALPGIGEVTAARIVEAREEQPFTAVDELRSREIVGEATFEKIRDLVTVGN